MPSILNDESIREIIKKEKKEDIKKSNILKESMRGYDGPMLNEKMYQSNIKMLKFQQKLNKKVAERAPKSSRIISK